jgi:hypothetical protein
MTTILLLSPAALYAGCTLKLQNITSVSYEYGGVWYETITYHYGWVCSPSAYPPGDPGTGEPSSPPPSPAPSPVPSIQIDAISDWNPEDLRLFVTWSNASNFDLYLGGQFRGSFATYEVSLGSLQNINRDGVTELEVVAAGPGGQARSKAWIDRWVQQSQEASSDFNVRWSYTDPFTGHPTVSDMDVRRWLSTRFVRTLYSCEVYGPRNGQYFHEKVFDDLGWNKPVGVAFTSTYSLSAPVPTHHTYPCYASRPGYVAAGGCAEPEQFSRAFDHRGIGRIPSGGLQVSFPGSTGSTVFFGNELVVYPW